MRKLLALVLSSLLVVTPAFADRTVYAPVRLAPVATAGTVLFADGTAAAPSISFSADTDTGVFRPGNNQLGVTLGGTERMRITSAGDVGIGTNAPTQINGGKVTHVYTNSNTSTIADNQDFIVESVNRNTSLYLRSSNTSAATLHFGDQANSGIGRIQYDHATDSMTFRTNAADRMTITSTGQIQVGDGSAAAPVLSFASDTDTGVYRFGADQIGFASGGVARGAFVGQGFYIGNGDANASPNTGSVRGTNGSGTNIAGASLLVRAGAGTGTAAGGFIALQTAAAGGVSGASLNTDTERVRVKATGQVRFVPLAADPAGAEAGDVYYNSGTNKLKVYNGTAWVDLH